MTAYRFPTQRYRSRREREAEILLALLPADMVDKVRAKMEKMAVAALLGVN